MSHCETSTFDHHFDYRLIVLKESEFLVLDGVLSMSADMTLMCFIGMRSCMFGLTIADGFPRSSLLGPSVLFGTEWNTSITNSQGVTAGIPSIRKTASREMISASAELCEAEVCLSHIQLIGTNVWLQTMYKTPPYVVFESSRSLAKSECWNSPSLHCLTVLST